MEIIKILPNLNQKMGKKNKSQKKKGLRENLLKFLIILIFIGLLVSWLKTMGFSLNHIMLLQKMDIN